LLRRASAGVAGLATLGGGIVVVGSGQAGTPPAVPVPVAKLASLGSVAKLEPPRAAGPLGPEGVPVPNAPDLAGTLSGTGQPEVDGIQCLGNEQLLFHIHAHLTMYVNGAPRRLPYGIGIVAPQGSQTPTGPYVSGGRCFYWLHTHAADGIVHIESPIKRTFTLGNLFDVWRQPLSPTRMGPARGRVTVLYNGGVYRGNPRNVPLNAHAQIQLEVGTPFVAPARITFPSGL
jgi:hypothetical protein